MIDKQYKCRTCGAIFAEAKHMEEYADSNDTKPCYEWEVCPKCGDEDIIEVEECECGEYKDKNEILCEKCEIATAKEYENFMEHFSEKQREYLEQYL